MSKSRIIGILILIGAALLFPIFWDNPYIVGIIILAFISAMVALCLRLMMLIDLINLSGTAFLAVGAYSSAILVTHLHLSVWWGLVLAIVVSGIMAFLLGIPTLRTKRVYFIVMTFALNEIVRLIITHVHFFGGAAGVSNIPPISIGFLEFSSKISNYYFALGLLLLIVLFMARLDRSRFGLTLRSIRENDIVAEAVGINLMRYKLTVFVIASIVTSITGWLFAHYFRYITPADFGVWQSIHYLIMAQFGGAMYLSGPIFGAFFLVSVPELLRVVKGWEPVFFGGAIVLTMLFFPKGAITIIGQTGSAIIRLFKRVRGER